MAKEPTEHEIQAGFFSHFIRNHSGKYPGIEHAFAIPNAGKRSHSAARYMKAEGLRSGVPDIFIPVAKNGYHGLFIELKRNKRGKVSENQREWLQNLANQGYACVVAYGNDHLEEVVHEYFKDNPRSE